jgi:hypothetical protein
MKELKSKTFIPSRGCLGILLFFPLFPGPLEEFPVCSNDPSTSSVCWPNWGAGARG